MGRLAALEEFDKAAAGRTFESNARAVLSRSCLFQAQTFRGLTSLRQVGDRRLLPQCLQRDPRLYGSQNPRPLQCWAPVPRCVEANLAIPAAASSNTANARRKLETVAIAPKSGGPIRSDA